MDTLSTSTPATQAPTPWKITHVADSELEAFTAVQYQSFIGTGNVLHDIFFPPASDPTPEDIVKSADRHRAVLTAKRDNLVCVKITDNATGEIAGGAKWYFYDKDAGRKDKVNVDAWAAEGEREITQRIIDEVHGRRVSLMAGPHALLDLCFTNPAYSRRGVASALVQFGCERADKMGVRAFVEASAQGQPVYARHGFVAKERVYLKYDDECGRGKEPAVWYHMEREPGAGAKEGRTL